MAHHPPHPRQPHPHQVSPFLKPEELEAEERVLRMTLANLTNERANAQAELEQRLLGLRQYLSEQQALAQARLSALHQQLAAERSRTSGQLQGQIQRVRSPLQLGLALLSPTVARENLRTLQASRQAMLRPTPQEQWLLSQMREVERTIDAWRRELVQPRDTPRMQELRRRIAWLTGEMLRLQVQADRLAARAAALRQQPIPLPQAPVQAGQTTSTLPAGVAQPTPVDRRECWHCWRQIVVTPQGTCPRCGAPIKPVP
jgi:hypothetical protein